MIQKPDFYCSLLSLSLKYSSSYIPCLCFSAIYFFSDWNACSLPALRKSFILSYVASFGHNVLLCLSFESSSLCSTHAHLFFEAMFDRIELSCNHNITVINNNVSNFSFRCEPFSTYPRTYDLLHLDGLFTAESHR